MNEPDPPRGRNRRADLLRLAGLLILVVAILLAFRYTHVSARSFTPDRLGNYIRTLGTWGPVIFIALYALRAVILVIPVGILGLAAGLTYGPLWGWAVIMVGATLGSCLAFLVARYLGRGFLERFPGLKKGRIGTYDEMSERAGFKLILFLRLIPLFQYDAVNFGAGLSRMRFRDFALGTLIGMAPAGFVVASLGSSLPQPKSLQFIVSLGLFALLVLAPVIYKAVRRSVGGKDAAARADGEFTGTESELAGGDPNA
jgi:uncharacterized membrane protein YdjX (TVP38/TMEM64 family)